MIIKCLRGLFRIFSESCARGTRIKLAAVEFCWPSRPIRLVILLLCRRRSERRASRVPTLKILEKSGSYIRFFVSRRSFRLCLSSQNIVSTISVYGLVAGCGIYTQLRALILLRNYQTCVSSTRICGTPRKRIFDMRIGARIGKSLISHLLPIFSRSNCNQYFQAERLADFLTYFW